MNPGNTYRFTFTSGFILLFAFMLPVYPAASVIPLVAALTAVVATKMWRNDPVPGFRSMTFFFLLYYIIHAAGLVYSRNISYALLDLQIKLPFLIMPFAIIAARVETRRITNAFVAGCLVAGVILLSLALIDYFQTGRADSFLYGKLSHWHHPTYITAFFNLALVFMMHEWFMGKRNAFMIASGIFLLIMILLLSSRTSIGVTYFTLVLFPVLAFGKNLFGLKILPKYMLFLLAIFILFFASLRMNTRFDEVQSAVSAHVGTAVQNKTDSPNSTNMRLHVWKYSGELILRNALAGVGTGDLHDELRNIYSEKHYQPAIDKKLNPHNQFLHTGVILGFPGMIILSGMLLFPFIQSVRRRDWLCVAFLSIIILNCLTESFLERQAGVIFFAFFTMYFMQRQAEVYSERGSLVKKNIPGRDAKA